MNLIADSVRQSYPDEKGYVDKREKEIMDMWDDLQRKMAERAKALKVRGIDSVLCLYEYLLSLMA